MKTPIKIFVSYAHKNSNLAISFIEQFSEYIAASKTFEFSIWEDIKILVGEKWDEKIIEKLSECDCGLLLISTAFLTSKYVTEKELPVLLKKNKILIPVALQKIDFQRHDLKGLEEHQIYRFIDYGFKEPRSFGELKPRRRLDFLSELYINLEERLLNQYSNKI